MKHHFADLIDRTGGVWTITPNAQRWSCHCDDVADDASGTASATAPSSTPTAPSSTPTVPPGRHPPWMGATQSHR